MDNQKRTIEPLDGTFDEVADSMFANTNKRPQAPQIAPQSAKPVQSPNYIQAIANWMETGKW